MNSVILIFLTFSTEEIHRKQKERHLLFMKTYLMQKMLVIIYQDSTFVIDTSSFYIISRVKPSRSWMQRKSWMKLLKWRKNMVSTLQNRVGSRCTSIWIINLIFYSHNYFCINYFLCHTTISIYVYKYKVHDFYIKIKICCKILSLLFLE